MDRCKGKNIPRYSLIIETVDSDKYYYDVSLGTFVKMHKESDAKKATIQALDFLTSVEVDKDELAKKYGINEQVSRVYLSYKFKGEKLLAPVFNNSFWSFVAFSYNGKEVNVSDEKILEQVRHLYFEIADPESEFSKQVLENKTKMINICQKTRTNIEDLVAHERAIRDNDTYGNTSFNSCNEYTKDRYEFYQDFLKSMRNYRDFRALYLNYCKYMGYKEKARQTDDEPKKKRIVPPEQLSMFSEGLIQ